jgi:hypothetical protein
VDPTDSRRRGWPWTYRTGDGSRSLPTVDRLLNLPVVRAVSPAVRRLLAGSSLYWRVAPEMHRRIRYRSESHVDPPLDPFQLYRVDPAAIRRFTGREFPVWRNRWGSLGAVTGGDWDRREPPISPSYEGPAPEFYLADTFEQTPLHRAMRAHFHDDVPWTETEFVRRVLAAATDPDAPSVWHECSSRAEVLAHCRSLDRLYESLRTDGCVPARQHETRYEDELTVRGVMSNEILVDVGRDGEPLFVSGRHRLSIAKLLGLDTVPVAVAVRHPDCLDGQTPDDRSLAHPGDPIDVPW